MALAGRLEPDLFAAKCAGVYLNAGSGTPDPAKAAPGTIRKDFADSIESNIAHGSDAPETAAFEIGYFFSGLEIFE